ncbi:MAG: hypothetical protein IJ538_01210 [Clostridia bacterium]|nr:hypothetical protein [Clostridia bacterium]
MDVIEIIDELENEFAKSKNFLWTKKSLINVDRCSSLLGQLKANLPTSIQEANYILSKKDQIIHRANQDAQVTVKEAEFRAKQLVSGSEVVKKGENEAEFMIADAEKRCAELYEITKKNIDKLLENAENYLNQNLEVIRGNRKELDEAMQNLKNLKNN